MAAGSIAARVGIEVGDGEGEDGCWTAAAEESSSEKFPQDPEKAFWSFVAAFSTPDIRKLLALFIAHSLIFGPCPLTAFSCITTVR